MTASRLLLVEDDSSLGETLQERLRREGYEVDWVSTQAEAERVWRGRPFDLIILDVGLPDGSGFDFARKIAAGSTPFLFVTAMNGAEARLEGYEIGAEEFIPKPFHLKELLLRVRHVLETHAPGPAAVAGGASTTGPATSAASASERLLLGDGSVVEFASRRVLRVGGRTEFLPAREFELLRLLLRQSPRVVSRDEILNEVWGEDKFPSHRTVDNAVLRLRQMLGEDGGRRIRSVRGIGYQWLGDG